MGWNPSNTVEDECFEKGECTWGTESLFKLTNGALENRFYEAFSFVQKFSLRSSDINNILQKKHKIYLQNINQSLQMSEAMIW